MDYPSLPTDNLYKFIALAGLALLLISATYPVSKILELETELIAANAENAKLSMDKDEIDRLLSDLKRKSDASLQDLALIRERHVQSKAKTIEFSKSVETMRLKFRWVTLYVAASVAGSMVGLLLTVAGFRLWYVRVQRQNDLLLAKQCKEAA